jgi:hypothetical protein
MVLQAHPAGTADDKIRVYKSTDLGVTWVEKDSANAPQFYQSNTSSPIDTFYNSANCGSRLRITYVPQGGSPGATAIAIIEFDMSTDTWGAPLTGGPIPGDDMRFKTVLLVNGSTYRTIFQDLTGASRWRVSVATYNGSWSSPTVLFDPGVDEAAVFDYLIAGVQLDPDDNIGILCAANISSAGNIRYRQYSSAGLAGTFIRLPHLVQMTVGAGPETRTGTSCVVPLSDSTYAFAFAGIGIIAVSSGSARVPVCMIFDPGASPLGSRVDAIHAVRSAASPGSLPSANVLHDAVQSALLVYWSHYDGVSQFKIRRAGSKFVVGWSGLSDVFVPALSDTINAVAAQILNGTRVGIAFSAFSDTAVVTYQYPFYYEEDVPTISAPGCGGGTGASYRIT